MSPIILSVLVFAAVAIGIAGVVLLLNSQDSNKAEDRLRTMLGQKSKDEPESQGVMKGELMKEGLDGLIGIINRFVNKFKGLRLLFEQADSPISAEAFAGVMGISAVVGVVAAIALNAPAPLWPIAGIVTGVLPLFWMMWRRSSRLAKFQTQLPDALELIGRALRSGHSLASGLHVVVDEMPAPISQEFGMAYEAQNLGIPIETALKDMLRRVPNLDLKFFVTSVAIQRQTGGDLAEILDKIGHIIRERFRILGQVQALTGEGRISGIVLMGLPIALFFAVYYLNSSYIMLLFTDPLGKKMIAGAIVLQILGAICIKKIVNIKV